MHEVIKKIHLVLLFPKIFEGFWQVTELISVTERVGKKKKPLVGTEEFFSST